MMRTNEHAALVSVSMLLLAALGIQGNAVAAADDNLAQCAQEKVTFDGIKPLKYADVIGDAGSRVVLNRQHPALCKSTSNAECAGKAYLVPGNTVAVANTCGEYAHVQFIGEKKVSYGWIDAKQLKEHPIPAHPEDMTPHAAEGSNLDVQRYPFKLIKGHGVPVCEAYLQRLNQTPFPNLPSCGRPENNEVPGFAWLNRGWVSDEEFNKTFNAIEGFISNRLPGTQETRFLGPFTTWRYSPPIDIDNDGMGDNVVIWNMDNRDRPDCGQYYFGNIRRRGGQEAVIMTGDGTQVDKEKTMSIFGRSEQVVTTAGMALSNVSLPGQKRNFWAIGTDINIFEYRNSYYLDTFYDTYGLGNFSGDRNTRGDPKLKDTLAVILNQQGHSQEICTYFLMDNKQGK